MNAEEEVRDNKLQLEAEMRVLKYEFETSKNTPESSAIFRKRWDDLTDRFFAIGHVPSFGKPSALAHRESP